MNNVQAAIDRAVSNGYSKGITALVGAGDEAQVMTAGEATRDSIFRIASNTKPITAVATLLLVQDGVFALTDPVDRWLPELANRQVLKRADAPLAHTVPAKRALTVEDLLTFRCGLGMIAGELMSTPLQRKLWDLRLDGPPDPLRAFGFDAFMKQLEALPLQAQPGEGWFYTVGSNLLGVLIERASGKALGDFFHERIFAPLGMKDTAFYATPDMLPRLTPIYHRDNGYLVLDDDPTHSAYAKPPVFAAGDGGLLSTVDDLFAFARMIGAGGKPIMEASAIADMTTNHLTTAQREYNPVILSKGWGWGYGGAVAVETTPQGCPRGTYGWGGGLGTTWYTNPQSRKTSIVLTETKWESPDMPQVHKDVLEAVFA